MRTMWMTCLLFSALAIASPPVTAQTRCSPDGIGGVRCNDGGGWAPDGLGGWQGTGNNSGSGVQPDGLGGWRGTGNSSGSGWSQDGLGGMRGTGDNTGGGWAPDGLGVCAALETTRAVVAGQMGLAALSATETRGHEHCESDRGPRPESGTGWCVARTGTAARAEHRGRVAMVPRRDRAAL